MFFGKGRSAAKVVPIVLRGGRRGRTVERGDDCLDRRPRIGRDVVNEGYFKAEEKDLVAEAKTSPVED